LSDPEELLQLFEADQALRALRDGKLVSNLIAGSVAASARPAALADEADREASFSVYKTNNPAFLPQPFLLVFRTVRIVTAHTRSVGEYRTDTRVFQHIAECDPRCYQRGGQRIYLRTVHFCYSFDTNL